MIVKTKIFELPNNGSGDLAELAQAMGISASQICDVREGARQVDEEFIVGALKAFPGHKLDDLFYLVPESLPRGSPAKVGAFWWEGV